jgi:hypothetical protein
MGPLLEFPSHWGRSWGQKTCFMTLIANLQENSSSYELGQDDVRVLLERTTCVHGAEGRDNHANSHRTCCLGWVAASQMSHSAAWAASAQPPSRVSLNKHLYTRHLELSPSKLTWFMRVPNASHSPQLQVTLLAKEVYRMGAFSKASLSYRKLINFILWRVKIFGGSLKWDLSSNLTCLH